MRYRTFFFATTDLFHYFTRDWLTVAVHRSLGHDDDVQTGAAASLLRGINQPFEVIRRDFFFLLCFFFLAFRIHFCTTR